MASSSVPLQIRTSVSRKLGLAELRRDEQEAVPLGYGAPSIAHALRVSVIAMQNDEDAAASGSPCGWTVQVDGHGAVPLGSSKEIRVSPGLE